jgi:hypothetical protein
VYYFDNVEGDQRLPHFDESLPPVDVHTLQRIRVEYWFIPVDKDGNWEQVCVSLGTGGGGTKSSCERRSIRLLRKGPTRIET